MQFAINPGCLVKSGAKNGEEGPSAPTGEEPFASAALHAQ